MQYFKTSTTSHVEQWTVAIDTTVFACDKHMSLPVVGTSFISGVRVGAGTSAFFTVSLTLLAMNSDQRKGQLPVNMEIKTLFIELEEDSAWQHQYIE